MPLKQIRRLGVEEAENSLSEVLRDAAQGPTIIHDRGKDLAVVLAIEDYESLQSGRPARRPGGAAFLERVEALKRRHGGGVDDFTPARFNFVPAEPFPPEEPERG